MIHHILKVTSAIAVTHHSFNSASSLALSIEPKVPSLDGDI